MKEHKNSGKNPKYCFPYAIRKYGWENFTKEILIDEVPEEDLNNLEINYIAFYDSCNREKGYNRTKGGEGLSGYKYTKEQCIAHGKRRTKNHSVEGGGCISFDVSRQVWKVWGFQSLREHKYIGQYLTEEKAVEALELYNQTGECMPSYMSIRKSGTGSINKQKSGRFTAIYKGKCVGTFASEEEAELAIKKRKKDISEGGVFVSTISRQAGTGSISKLNSGRFHTRYKGQNVGTFASEEEAEQALKKRKKDISEGGVFVSTRRKKGTGYIRKKKNGRFTAIYQQKTLGTFDTNDEADQALKIHIVNLKK